jgi:hypothetical protein
MDADQCLDSCHGDFVELKMSNQCQRGHATNWCTFLLRLTI